MQKNIWTTAPALYPAVGICIGIPAGFFLLSDISLLCVVLIGVSCLSAVSYLLYRRKSEMAVGLTATVLGLILGWMSVPNILPSEIDGKKGKLCGKVEKVTRTSETMRAVVHATEWTPDKESNSRAVDFNAICILRGVDNDIIPGVTLSVKGKLQNVEPKLDVPLQTDYSRFLYIDKVVARIATYSSGDYTIDGSTIGKWQKFLSVAQDKWLSAIVGAGFDEPTTAFLLTVIGGDDLLLSDNIEEQFRQTGLSHILAISGMHVAIILSILALILYPVKLIRRMRPFYFIGLSVLIVLYALITGGSPSACRAAAMCCILMGDRILETRSNPLQCLGMAVVVLLCIKPLWIFLPGFQLSVCAVLAIISAWPLFNIIPLRYHWLRNLWAFVLLPVVAIIGTFIPTIFYFHSISVNFWLANIVAAVFIPFVVGIGFIGAILSFFGLSSSLITMLGNALFGGMDAVIDSISRLWTVNSVPVYLSSEMMIFIGVMTIALIVLIWRYSHRYAIGWILAMLMGLVFVPYTDANNPKAELYIPRHYNRTDVLIVKDGENYLWTTAKDTLAVQLALKDVKNNYHDFYRHRGVGETPKTLSGFHGETMFQSKDNVLLIGGRKIARIDDEDNLPLDMHVDVALVSELFKGNITDIVNKIDADSLYLSAAINYMRHQKFVRQLNTLNRPYRSLRDEGLIWQFK